MTGGFTGLKDFANTLGRFTKQSNKAGMDIKRHGSLKLELEQPGGIKKVTLETVSYVPGLGYNLLLVYMASKASTIIVTLRAKNAIVGAGDSAYKFRRRKEVYATATEIVLPIALRSTGSCEQDIMHFHELLGHPYEMPVKITMKPREDGQLGRRMIDFSAPNSVPSFGRTNHVVRFVNDYSRIK